MSSHRAAFEYFKALRAADTVIGLNAPGTLTYLYGGFVRRGDPQRTFQVPWVEFEIAGEREQDSMGDLGDRVDLIVRTHLFTNRDTMYTSLAGNQNSVAARMRAVFHGVTPTHDVLLGWVPNKIYRVSGQQAPDNGAVAHYIETYLMRMSEQTIS